jgi:hypothetical protein
MTEPHRFTSIMNCLTRLARQIVQQTPCYSQGQTYVIPLLMSVLAGIDLNDSKKTLATLEFLDTILMVITCVDCSSSVNTRNDLTEVRFNFNFEKNMNNYSSFFLPTKYSWTTKEKLWPSIARLTHAKKASTQKLIEVINKRICKEFVTEVIIQNTNEISMHAAAALWRPLEPNEAKMREECSRTDIQSYNNLMEMLNSLLKGDTLQVLFFFNI